MQRPSFMRSSKFRHVYGTASKKEKCYNGIDITRISLDCEFCSVNGKFMAVAVRAARGGGAFLVAPLEKTGQFDPNYPEVYGHRGEVLDIQWNPFDDNEIASCSEDCTIKLWTIPDGGLSETMVEPKLTLEGHTNRVLQLSWHPCASNILASHDYNVVIIWNTIKGERCFELSHRDHIFSMSWNYDGSQLATTCKDKKIRIFDPRKQELLSEVQGHEGSKPSRVVFCGKHNLLCTTGFSRMSQRQYALWDPKDLFRSLVCEEIDRSNGVLFPYYDDGTDMIYLVGKGDTSIQYYELQDNNMYYITTYQSASPQRGGCFMPKRSLDHMSCEVMRLYKLHQNMVEPITFVVPRKSQLFQEDLFPPCPAGIPALTADEWVAGVNKDPVLVNLKELY